MITQNQATPNQAAIKVLKLLDDEGLSLYGNGWLDDDPEMLQAIGADSGEQEGAGEDGSEDE